MEEPENIKIGKRLYKLRNRENLSQPQLAILLSKKVKIINLSGDNGKAVVSQLEHGKRGLTIPLACAYAEIFDVTLDYLYGHIGDEKPEYKTVKEQTGLSDQAIRNLSEHVSDKPEYQEILSRFLGHPNFKFMMLAIYSYFEARNNTIDLEYMLDYFYKHSKDAESGNNFDLHPNEIVQVRKLQYEERFREIVNDITDGMVNENVKEKSER